MSHLNHQVFEGNLGADASFKQLQGGRQLCNLRVASKESYKNRDDEWVDTVTWMNVTIWGDAAARAKDWQKGDHVMVLGKLNVRSYDDKDGIKRISTEIIVSGYGHQINNYTSFHNKRIARQQNGSA